MTVHVPQEAPPPYVDIPWYTKQFVSLVPIFIAHWYPQLAASEMQTIVMGILVGMALPVATLPFAVGVLIRTRSLHADQTKTLVLWAILAVALSVIPLSVNVTTNLLASGELH